MYKVTIHVLGLELESINEKIENNLWKIDNKKRAINSLINSGSKKPHVKINIEKYKSWVDKFKIENEGLKIWKIDIENEIKKLKLHDIDN